MTDVGLSDLLPDQLAPEAASARIAELKADPNFTEKYMAGEVGARAEFQRLHSQAFGKNAPDDMVQRRATGIDMLREFAALPDKVWDAARRNEAVYQHEYDLALRTKEQCFKDKAWVARYLDGGREERSLMLQTVLILSSPIRKEGTAK